MNREQIEKEKTAILLQYPSSDDFIGAFSTGALSGYSTVAIEEIFSLEPWTSFWYALTYNRRFKLGEPAIAKYPDLSFRYAIIIIGGRFKLGENVISKNSYYAFLYARRVLNGQRFPLWEEQLAVMTDQELPLYEYALYVIMTGVRLHLKFCDEDKITEYIKELASKRIGESLGIFNKTSFI